MEELLNDIDDLLARFEDFTHGKDGEDITKIRHRISLVLYKKENITDKELLANYKLGWDDCSNNEKAKIFALKPMQKAYTHGWVDFMAGDDISSVDDQSDEEILAYIRGVKK